MECIGFFSSIGNASRIVVPVNQPIKSKLLDFTGILDSQIPSMKKYKRQKYGQDYYDVP